MINWYLKRHVDKLFACSIENVDIEKNNEIIPFRINQEDLQKVASYLNNAKRPVLILGGQATKRIDFVSKLSKELKNSKIPTFLASMSRGLLGKDHQNYFRHGRNKALRKVDVMIIC